MKTQIRNCNKAGCVKQATQEVRLSLAVHASHPPAISGPIMHLCDEHAPEVTWQSINVDDNWDNICTSFENIGMAAPKKRFSKLIIQPIQDNEIFDSSALS